MIIESYLGRAVTFGAFVKAVKAKQGSEQGSCQIMNMK